MANTMYYRGKALVVGNDHYDQMKPDLDNAVNDAKGIYQAFQDLGFMMMPEAYDIGFQQFDELFDKFKSNLAQYEVGVLYFSGHGIEIEGKNYLIMKDTPIGDLPKSTIRFAIDLQDSIKELHATHCKMIIVIIDACRNNPFEGKERGWGSVNLAPLFVPKGTLIAYSTSPGETASDFGMDGHSVYTGALLKHLKEEGLEVETFFKKVRSTVDAMTGGKKTSWEHTSLIGSFSFNSGKMTHIGQVGYDMTVVQDALYKSDKVLSAIIKDLKSYNWYNQNEGVDDFMKLNPQTLDKNQLFIVGRNLLQAAVGGSHHAQGFISDSDKLCKYTQNGENHLLNGILFEIYFNKEGKFRYKNFKSMYLGQLMNHVDYEPLKCSFGFICNVLKEFAHFLIFLPTVTPQKVAINVRLEKEIVNLIWTEPTEMLAVNAILFEGHELLADDDESNVFPFHTEREIKAFNLRNLLSEGYAIPQLFLDLIFNVDPGDDYIWFNHKLRQNFRYKQESDDFETLCEMTSV